MAEGDATSKGEWWPEGEALLHIPESSDEQDLKVTVYHGADDGKPVVQIDGDADFRVNVNDWPIWDGPPDKGGVADVAFDWQRGLISGDEAMKAIAGMPGVIPNTEED